MVFNVKVFNVIYTQRSDLKYYEIKRPVSPRINPRNFPECNYIVGVLAVSDTLSFANLDAIDIFRT